MRRMATLWNEWLRMWGAWRARRARQELHELSDRTLNDIGLRRGEIESLFR